MAALLPSLKADKWSHGGVSIVATAASIALLYYGRVFCITIVVSIALAILLDPLVVLGMRLRMPRALASVAACILALAVLYLTGLGAYFQILALKDDLPVYSARVNELLDTTSARFDAAESRFVEAFVPKRLREAEPAPLPIAPARASKLRRRAQPTVPAPVAPIQEVRIRPEPRSIFVYLYSYLTSVYSVLLMASFVPFLVYFILSWRDHFRRTLLELLPGPERHAAAKASRDITGAVRAYVLGNFLLGLLLSLIGCLFFFFIGLPYWLLAGILSGFLSLVPYAGLPLALVPPLLGALTVFTTISPFLIVAAVVAALHLFAINFLYPRVVGGRLHLNPLAVTVSLMFWGTLWGAIGLVLAIPITAGVKAVCDNVPALQGYGNLLGD